MAAILPLCNCSSTSTVFPYSFIPFSPLFPNKTHKITPPTLLFSASSTSVSFIQRRTGFSVSGSRRTKTNNDVVEMDGEDELDNVDGETLEDNCFVLPFGEMTNWFRNKPTGFGEGKVYDTSLEEKLSEEIEQSRRAQLANINKLQNSPKKSTPKKQEQEAIEDFSGRTHVHLGNLPKKKNIQRDLQLAFKGFPGTFNISAAVSANKKTRDPVCKGFAFVYFDSEEAAHRFTELYSKQDIKFGKIQKQIKFEIKNPKHTSNSASQQLAEGTYISSPRLSFPNMDSERGVGSHVDTVLYDSEEEMTEGSVGVAITASHYTRFLPLPPAQAISNILRTKKAFSLNSNLISPFLVKSKKSSIWVASKRVSVETEQDVWEDADDGSSSEYEEEDWGSQSDYEGERKATPTVDNAKTAKSIYDEFVKEVELLLEPEEKAIIRQNEAPVLSKISTAKWSPFHSLGLSGQIPFMDKLLEYGVDIDAVDKDGFTALHKAVIAKKEAVISHLLRKGANPHVRDADGATPLHYAVQVGAMQTVKLLIKYKVDVNVEDNEGWTPLHVAIQSRCRDIAKVLLVSGADKTRRNKDGKTPLDLSLCYGKDFKSYELAKLLKLVPANRDP